jgi:membrane protease YdiL (CAAX protease family)
MFRNLAIIRFLCDGRYRPDTNWIWWQAFLATVLILTAGIAAMLMLNWIIFPRPVESTGWGFETLILVFYMFIIWGTIRTAKQNNYGGLHALHLNSFAPIWPIVILAAVLFVLDSTIADLLCRSYIAQCTADAAIFVESFKNSAMPLSLFTAVVAAPIAEEILFRGFLQSAMANSRIGFWWGSVLVTLTWTTPHMYSLPGMLAVASSGIVLTYLLWRTNSILPGILYHMATNAYASLMTWMSITS